MIIFSCPSCRRSFSVPDASAGRAAHCRCGQALVVPDAGGIEARPQAPVPRAFLLPVRTRRLLADAREVQQALADFPLIRVHAADGAPPEVYEVDYFIEGLEPGPDDQPRCRDSHRARIQLTADYPRLAPHCKMLTPIFHPNIDPTTICVGDHWTAGARLLDLFVRIGQMIAYQDYNVKSPLDPRAAMWADLNSANLPIDSRNLTPPERGS